MEAGPVRRQAQRAPRWFADGILILVSAAVGFGAAQFGEYRNDRELAGRTLAGLRAELEHNLSQLDPIVPVHQEWVAALRNADSAAEGSQSALDVSASVSQRSRVAGPRLRGSNVAAENNAPCARRQCCWIDTGSTCR